MKRCGHKKSLVGERFGRLVILSCLSEVGEKHPKWDALCDCGKHKVVTTTKRDGAFFFGMDNSNSGGAINLSFYF